MPSSHTLSATDFKVPAVTLSGVVDYEMYVSFRKQFAVANQDLIIVELSTLGGDPGSGVANDGGRYPLRQLEMFP